MFGIFKPQISKLSTENTEKKTHEIHRNTPFYEQGNFVLLMYLSKPDNICSSMDDSVTSSLSGTIFPTSTQLIHPNSYQIRFNSIVFTCHEFTRNADPEISFVASTH